MYKSRNVLIGDYFTIVTMKTKTNKTLFLMEGQGKTCSWTFDKEEAIWFPNEAEAEKFCKKYFKNFKDYEIETIIG